MINIEDFFRDSTLEKIINDVWATYNSEKDKKINCEAIKMFPDGQ